MEKNCKHHGWGEHSLYAKRWRCLKCEAERKKTHREKMKDELVERFGGCCKICGYSRYRGALEVHHLDPSTKEFSIASKGWMAGREVLVNEAVKCIVLCANCHREVEAGVTKIAEWCNWQHVRP
jgi:predicted HNH restriction endonuclease